MFSCCTTCSSISQGLSTRLFSFLAVKVPMLMVPGSNVASSKSDACSKLGISLPSLAWSHPSNSSKALTASANTRYPFDLSMFGWLSYPFDLSIFGWLSSCRKNDGLLFVQGLLLSVNCPKQNADGQCQHPVPFRRLNIWVAIKVPEK